MLRIQPQSIILVSPNHYSVRFQKADAHLDYTFSVEWTGAIGVLNCDQREFFFDTHDDPATKLLLKAIDLFDESERNNTSTQVLKSLSVAQGNEDLYIVVVQSNNEDVEFVFSMKDQNSPTLVSDNHFSKITNADCIKQVIANFHQARQFEYAANTQAQP